jgi:hypothetical protein
MKENNLEVQVPPRKQKKLQLRFPLDEILEDMRRLAKEDNRSLNGEIMQALREFIKQRKAAK